MRQRGLPTHLHPLLSPTGGGGSSDDNSECVGWGLPHRRGTLTLTVGQDPPYKRVYIHLSARSVCKRASGCGNAACPRTPPQPSPTGEGGSSDDNSECVGWGLLHHSTPNINGGSRPHPTNCRLTAVFHHRAGKTKPAWRRVLASVLCVVIGSGRRCRFIFPAGRAASTRFFRGFACGW